MKKYNHYKDSKIDWIGEIPEHWEMVPNKYIFNLKQNLVGKKSEDYELLSLTLRGIIKRDMENPEGKFPASFEKYQEVKKDDFIFCFFDVEETPRTVGLSTYEGMITGAYTVFEVDERYSNKFLYYFYLNLDNDKRLRFLYRGLRNTIPKESFNAFKTLVPPLQEQTAIANFLDEKTSKIDKAVQIKEREIELLKERRQILIQEVVTGKKVWVSTSSTTEVSTGSIDGKWVKPEKTKDSGVDWIGEIPEDWEVRKLKQICEINKKTLPENTTPNFELDYIDIGSVSFENGIEKTEKYLFKNAPSRARRIANRGNTIISTVRTYLKAIDFINQEKEKFIYSTGFAVLKPNKEIYPEYLFTFVRSNVFTEQVRVNSTGMSYPAINSTTLGSQRVLFMSIEQQKQIVSYLENLESKIAQSISLKEQEIEKLKEYKTVLIDSAVTGKIRVN